MIRDSMHEDDSLTVTLVTVTYGNRWSLLKRALRSALDHGIANAIVVDNGSDVNIENLVASEFGKAVKVVTLERNVGSAGGFAKGLTTAMQCEAEYILLLDDDNEIQPDCLPKLFSAYKNAASRQEKSDLAVLAFRPEHQVDVARGFSARNLVVSPSSFFGFHVFDLPAKIWRRFGAKKNDPDVIRPVQKIFPLEIAPYSGMLFHNDVVKKHGLPDERLVLYADDSDFSYRITKAGGEILLVTDARIVDMDSSWNAKENFKSSFDLWLTGGTDFRAYYAARNQSYFERHRRGSHGPVRVLNRLTYITIMYVRAIQLGAEKRARLFHRSVVEGEAGQLGMNSFFRLKDPRPDNGTPV